MIRWIAALAAAGAALLVIVTAVDDGDRGLEMFAATILLAAAWFVLRPPDFSRGLADPEHPE